MRHRELLSQEFRSPAVTDPIEPHRVPNGTARTLMLSVVLLAMLSPSALAQTTPSTMPANTWLSVPNSHMEDVEKKPQDYADYSGGSSADYNSIQGGGVQNVIDAWGGAALDTRRSRLVLFGGGHGDYYGNELYAFDVPSLTWSRLTDPTVDLTFTSDINWDGTPPSRHSYGGLAYIEHADRYFASAGGLSSINGIWSSDKTWTFDFVSRTWTNRNPTPKAPNGGYECNASYDPATRKVWWGSAAGGGGLWSYDYDANAWTKHNNDAFYDYTSAIDTRRGLLIFVGVGQVFAYDIGNGNYTKQVWSTTGGSAFINQNSVGLDYDPTTDRIVGWSGGAVYALNTATRVWTSYNPPGTPSPGVNGIFGRWRYVPSVNAFVVVTGVDRNVYFYKLSAGGGVLPPTDTTPPARTVDLRPR